MSAKKLNWSFVSNLIREGKCLRAKFKIKSRAAAIRMSLREALLKEGLEVSTSITPEDDGYVLRVWEGNGMQKLINELFQVDDDYKPEGKEDIEL